ncbi:MAG: hypothetical protein P8J87_04655, partial [Verrucomicrobiales bacterium]|nr:hypothetical protein [Verrucomicrobiales bacterium]
MPDTTQPPWQDLGFFPEKPAGATYGYLTPQEKKKPASFHSCTLSELADTVATRPRGLLVATPDHERLVPPSLCRELWPAIDIRDVRRRHQERKDALLSCLIFGSIIAYSAVVGRSFELLAILLLVFLGVVPLVQNLIGTARHRLRGKRAPDFAETASRTLFSYWLGTRPITTTRLCVYSLGAVFAVQVLAEAPSIAKIFDYIIADPRSSIEA